jgi:SSS family solute:Na+ symporter
MALFLVFAFLAIMIGIGFWGLKKTSTLNDFFLGNRSIGPWISAMAYGTTYFSAVIFIGFAGKLGWQYGLNSLWIGIGNAFIGSLLAWLILARRTRRMTQNLDVMTMPEFFQERYQGRFLKMSPATIIFIFLLPSSASVFKGLGHLFEISFHIPYDLALFVMIAITGVYLILGGYFAITLTDFIQGIIMFCCTLAFITILFNLGGGFISTITKLTANYAQHFPLAKHPSMLMLAALVFMTSFGVWGMPQMVQKFYAIKNEKVIPRAALVTTIFALLIGTAAYFNGAMSHLFYTPQTLPLAGGKIIFDKIVPQMMIAHLPEWLMAFMLLLVLSASMSTLSS